MDETNKGKYTMGVYHKRKKLLSGLPYGIRLIKNTKIDLMNCEFVAK